MGSVTIGIGAIAIAKNMDSVITLGLGSCVGIALYDPVAKIAGLAHIMLPDSKAVREVGNRHKFADTGFEDLLSLMIGAGAVRSRMIAKLAGGAHMFSGQMNSDLMKVGERNVTASKNALAKAGIPVRAEDTGGICGRTVEIKASNGEYVIKTISKGIRSI